MANIVVDHDAGTNPDDCLAFWTLSKIPHTTILATISGNRFPRERALLAQRTFDALHLPTRHFVGLEPGCSDFLCASQISGYAAELETELDDLAKLIFENSPVTYLAIQGLSNLEYLLQLHPHLCSHIEVLHMGLTTTNYDSWIDGGTNMRADQLAAKSIYSMPALNLRAIGLQTTLRDELRLHPETPCFRWLQESCEELASILREQLIKFHQYRRIWPALHDPLAAAVAAGAYNLDFEEVFVDFNEHGLYRKGRSVRVLASKELTNPADFFQWFSRTVLP